MHKIQKLQLWNVLWYMHKMPNHIIRKGWSYIFSYPNILCLMYLHLCSDRIDQYLLDYRHQCVWTWRHFVKANHDYVIQRQFCQLLNDLFIFHLKNVCTYAWCCCWILHYVVERRLECDKRKNLKWRIIKNRTYRIRPIKGQSVIHKRYFILAIKRTRWKNISRFTF